MEELKITVSDFISEKQGKLRDTYKIGRKLGEGAFGSVRKIVHRVTGEIKAVKTIHKASLKSESEQQLFFNEVSILRTLDHPHIVRLFEFYQDDKNYYLITEFCSGGELFDKILDDGSFSEASCAKYMKEILSVLVYLHDRNIVHRDLKPENFILSTAENMSILKVIDFGTAHQFVPGESITQKFGTPYYIAPEVLRKSYNEKCDLWSAGVNMYVMLCGYPPFGGSNDDQILRRVVSARYNFPSPEWDNISFDAKELISRLICPDPEERLSARQAIEHPWLQNASSSAINRKTAKLFIENLKSFRADQKLQKATFTYIASQLATKQESEELLELFKSLDTDHSGTLSRKELLDGFTILYVDEVEDVEAEVDRIMNEVDIDRSGEIDYSEFVTATINKQKLLSEERLKTAFRMFDIDDSGKISADEIKNILGKYHAYDDAMWEAMIKEVDLNGDGEIDLSEFTQMMNKLIS